MLLFFKSKSTSKQGDDLRSNSFKERENDMNQRASPKSPLEIAIGHIIWFETKMTQEELIGLILHICVNKLQIYWTRPLYIMFSISRATGRFFLRF